MGFEAEVLNDPGFLVGVHFPPASPTGKALTDYSMRHMTGSSSNLWGIVTLVIAALALVLAGISMFRQPETVNTGNVQPSQHISTVSEGNSDNIQALEEKLAKPSDQVGTQKAQSTEIINPEDIEALNERIDELARHLEAADSRRAAKEEAMNELQAAASDPELQRRYWDYVAQQKNQQQAQIATEFLAEPVDDTWAPGMSSEITSAFDTAELSSANLISSDCRTTLCRVELAIVPDAASTVDGMSEMEVENDMLARLMRNLPSGTMKREPDAAGGYHYTLHLYRQGHKPPPPSHNLSGMSLDEIRSLLQSP